MGEADRRAAARAVGVVGQVAFTLAAPADAPATQVVARLEREDGFLLARGSAALEPGAPTTITLYTVMY